MSSPAEHAARAFHEAYERLAPQFGYETRRESAVPWDDVPEANRRLMVAVVEEVLAALVAQAEQAEAALREARQHLRPELGGRFDQYAAVAVIDAALAGLPDNRTET